MNRSSFLALFLLTVCFAAIATAQPNLRHSSAPPARATAPTAVVATAEPEGYYPARDPTARIGQPLYDDLEAAVWNTYSNQPVWNLDLDAPVNTETGLRATGESRSGFPFVVDFSVINTRAAGNDRVGYWTGKISLFGEYYCGGLYYEHDGMATLCPSFSFVNQAQSRDTFDTIIETTGGIVNHQNMHACAFDSIANFILGQNRINAQSCIDIHENDMLAVSIFCFVVGEGSCLMTFGAGCIGGLVCEVGLIIREVFWERSYANEWNRANDCLCLETVWRTEHPGHDLPNSSCGTFRCPPTNPFSIPSLKP